VLVALVAVELLVLLLQMLLQTLAAAVAQPILEAQLALVEMVVLEWLFFHIQVITPVQRLQVLV
jgi:hypothetical protein